ncbi:MAG: T9SS type A sorting domain-containing protein [Bacteroidales bacterium]|nr:T9SS type A sorting domain-containing protein [Bacteroidales bacterium]MCF8389935.1 T9SS type A sorting domain-containing protein [Bacteroidales bacterium]
MKFNSILKRTMSLLAMALFATSLMMGQISIKPIAHWAFDEGTGTVAADKSGNGHDATLLNMDETAWIEGKSGKALKFDAVDDKLSVNYDSLFDFKSKSFTHSMWVNLTDTLISGRLIAVGTYSLQQTNFGGSFMRVTVKSPGGNKLTVQTSDKPYVTQDWVLLTVVRDAPGQSVTFYANDQMLYTQTYGDAFLEWDFGPETDNPFMIGGNTSADPTKHQGTNGGLDDIRVYDAALNSDQVAELYNGTADILIAHWSFDEGTGTVAADLSGNGHDANLIGMDESAWVEGKLFNALNFDGVDDKLIVPYNEDFDFKASPFTYSMWINMAETPFTGRFLTYGTFGLQQTDFNGAFVRINVKSTSGSKLTVQTEDTPFIKGEWVLLTTTRDTTTKTVSFYANTQLVYSQEYGDAFKEWDFVSTNDTIVIGANNNPDPTKHQGAKGMIDEIRVYSKALTLDEITDLFAAGSVNYYDLTVSTAGLGSVKLSPAGGVYPEGSTVTLTAVPDDGNHFENWSGDLTGTQISTTLVMDGDKNVTATFAEGGVQYKLKINTIGDGYVARSTADTLIDAGTEVTLTAVAMEGNEFEQWTGTLASFDANLTFIISEDTELNAIFASAGPDYDVIQEVQSYDYSAIEGANLNKDTETYVWTNNPGFTGDGFIDFANEPNTWGEWILNAPSAGKYYIIFRYAHGGEGSRPSKIEIGGTVIEQSLDFPATGAWSIWKKVVIEADLQAGENTLKITALAADGMVNFDVFQLANYTTSVDPKTANQSTLVIYPNPVSDNALFAFKIEKAANVELNLFDMSGRKVKQIENAFMPAGENVIRWNASDVKTGLYVAHLTINNSALPKTVIVNVMR